MAKYRKKLKPQPPVDVQQPEPQKPPPQPPSALVAPRLLASGEWKALALILGITFLAYWNALGNGYVYDDHFQIERNPTLASLANIPKLFTQSVWQFMNLSSEDAVGLYYRPFFNIALIVNYHLFGFDPAAWHFSSIVLHLIATFFLYLLVRQWGLDQRVALAAGVLYGLHTIHVESVTWISAIPDPLCAAFLFPALFLYERFRLSPPKASTLYAASVALTLLAMFTKEVAIVVPAYIGLRELLDRQDGESPGTAFARGVKRALPFGIAAGVYIVTRIAVLGFFSKPEPKAVGISGVSVLLTIPSVILSYVRMLVLPYPLAIIYNHEYVDSPSDARFWGALIAVVAIATIVVWCARTSRQALFALAILVLFTIPVLNLKAFNPQESLLHDRYMYIPSAGFAVLLALGLVWLADRFGERSKTVFASGLAAISVVFFLTTYAQNNTWETDYTMAEHAMQVSPNWPFLYNYLGAQYSQAGKFAEAEQNFQKAIEINPNYYDAHANLGNVYRQRNQLDLAEQSFQRAIDLGANYADTFYNLGVTNVGQNKLAEAEMPLIRAIQLHPTNADARYMLGWVYDHENKPAEAEQSYRAALQIKPSYPEARINLGVLLTKQQRYPEALEQLTIAKQYAPTHPVLLFAFGDLSQRMGKFQDAVDSYTKLVQGQPQHPYAYTNMGLCYENLGVPQKARESFERAIQVAPNDPFTNTAREHLAKLQ